MRKNQRIFTLKKDLPGFPAGRQFKTTYDRKEVFAYMTDEEYIYGKEFQFYKFPIEFVEKNSDWFEENTDLQISLEAKTYSLEVVKKAFEVFRYVGFPHNNPTWEEWSEKNLR
jgi:hypothetical protein